MENSRLHSQEPSFRPEPLNQEPRWAIVTYRISLVSGPGGVINSNAHTAILLIAAPSATPDLGGGGERPSLLPDDNTPPTYIPPSTRQESPHHPSRSGGWGWGAAVKGEQAQPLIEAWLLGWRAGETE